MFGRAHVLSTRVHVDCAAKDGWMDGSTSACVLGCKWVSEEGRMDGIDGSLLTG